MYSMDKNISKVYDTSTARKRNDIELTAVYGSFLED